MASYADPDVVVETTRVAEHVADPKGIVESDEDVLLYDAGHILGASRRIATSSFATRQAPANSSWRLAPFLFQTPHQ